jgi:hypothetical protein
MDMNMPVSGATGDLEDVCARRDVIFPVGALTQTTESLNNEADHVVTVFLTWDGESEVFVSGSSNELSVADEELKTLSNAAQSAK